jgi:hypothetical protein
MNRRRNAEHEIKMKKTNISIVALALLLCAANIAVANDRDDQGGYHPFAANFPLSRERDDRRDYGCHGDSRHCLSAPEIDPGQALGALTLLGGALAVIRGFRRKGK